MDRNENMSATQMEIIGLGESVLELLDKEQATLEKGGTNVVVVRANMALAVEEAKAANALQESLKHQLTSSTQLTVAKMHRAYTVTSGTIDMMAASVDKTSNMAKIFQRMRSKLRQAGDQTTTEPLPVPVQEATQ